MALGWWLGWTPGAGLIFGVALSVASTVVLLRVLQERRLIETERGRITVGWLIVQGHRHGAGARAAAGARRRYSTAWRRRPARSRSCARSPSLLGKFAIFIAVMLLVGKKLIPAILHYVAHTGSRELFRLAVLSIALGCRLRRGRAVRRLAGAGRLLRRHDAERVAIEPAGRRPSRCRCATPSPCCSSSRSACCSIRRILVERRWRCWPPCHHPDRQVGRRLFRRAPVRARPLARR